MGVTQTVTAFAGSQWRKPRHVEVKDEHLFADFAAGSVYPLLEAAQDGRALRALIDARTDEEVCRFTQNWGLLYSRSEGLRVARFPLDLFHLERVKFLAIAQLSSALRSEAPHEIMRALQALRTVNVQRLARIYGRQLRDHVREQLPEHERALADLGIPLSQLLRARRENRKVSLQEHAAQALAAELQMPQFLRAVRKDREWRLEDVPAADTLEQVLRWSYRSQYRGLHHFFCEGCGQASVTRRSDARFCSEKCGGRIRVRRFRGNLAKTKRPTRGQGRH